MKRTAILHSNRMCGLELRGANLLRRPPSSRLSCLSFVFVVEPSSLPPSLVVVLSYLLPPTSYLLHPLSEWRSVVAVVLLLVVVERPLVDLPAVCNRPARARLPRSLASSGSVTLSRATPGTLIAPVRRGARSLARASCTLVLGGAQSPLARAASSSRCAKPPNVPTDRCCSTRLDATRFAASSSSLAACLRRVELALCPNNTEVRIYSKDGSGEWVQEDTLNEVRATIARARASRPRHHRMLIVGRLRGYAGDDGVSTARQGGHGHRLGAQHEPHRDVRPGPQRVRVDLHQRRLEAGAGDLAHQPRCHARQVEPVGYVRTSRPAGRAGVVLSLSKAWSRFSHGGGGGGARQQRTSLPSPAAPSPCRCATLRSRTTGGSASTSASTSRPSPTSRGTRTTFCWRRRRATTRSRSCRPSSRRSTRGPAPRRSVASCRSARCSASTRAPAGCTASTGRRRATDSCSWATTRP